MCICENPNKSLKNTHYKDLPIKTTIIKDKYSFGLGILNLNDCIAMFDIKFCPLCGNKLNLEKKEG